MEWYENETLVKEVDALFESFCEAEFFPSSRFRESLGDLLVKYNFSKDVHNEYFTAIDEWAYDTLSEQALDADWGDTEDCEEA